MFLRNYETQPCKNDMLQQWIQKLDVSVQWQLQEFTANFIWYLFQKHFDVNTVL